MTCVLPGIFAMFDEKSEACWLMESRVTLTLRFFRIASTPSASPCE